MAWDYSEKVKDHFLNPRNVGKIEAVDNLVQHCKRIQTILGNLHDCNVWISQIGSVSSDKGEKELIKHLEGQRDSYIYEFEEYIAMQFNDAVRENIKRSLAILV